MCGIVGFAAVHPDAPRPDAVVRRMARLLAHRGPDGEGFHSAPGVVLGHRRLAVIDPAGGAQPMANEDGTVLVVFNGEIENYRELRAELEGRGHRFVSRCDTEVLVHLYEERGESMVEALRGFFAYAVWDARTRRLLLARDRLGEKPLYYLARPDGFWFASEAKALLLVPGHARRIDPDGLDAYLTFLHIPSDRTFFEGVRKLRTAEAALVESGRLVRLRRYWRVSCAPGTASGAVERFRDLFADVVDRKLHADFAVGAFLSGGIDSGLVAAEAARRAGGLVTFTMGVEGDADLDERAAARKTVEWIGATGRFAAQEPVEFERLLPSYLWHMDEPTGGGAAMALLPLARTARKECKVVLSGNGGDEAFAGYPRFLIGLARATPAPAHWLRLWRRHGPGAFPPLLRRVFLRPFSRFYYDLLCFFDDGARRRLLEPGLLSARAAPTHLDRIEEALGTEGDLLARLQRLDWEVYLPSTLHPFDRMTMAVGLEGRSPFLDHHLVEFAAALPAAEKLDGPVMKPFLYRALPDHLPPEIWRMPKRGFPTPMRRWFRRDALPFLRRLLLEGPAARRGLFRRAAVERLFLLHRAGRDASPRLFQLASIEAWCRIFLDPPAPPETAEAAERAFERGVAASRSVR